MGSKYSTVSISGYNSSPPSDDGSQTAANQVKWSTQKDKIGDPLKTAVEAINTALVTFTNFSSRSVTASDSTLATDHMKTIEIASTTSSGKTISLMDAATAGAGYIVSVKNLSAYNQTVGRATSGDTLNGATANITLSPNEGLTFKVNASADGYYSVDNQKNVPTVRDNGAEVDGSTNDATALQAALTARATNGGELRLVPGTTMTGSTLNLSSLVHFVGEGDCSAIKLASSANGDVINTISFSGFTGSNKWFVDTESVAYGFALKNLRVDGNRTSQTATCHGIRLYGKGYTVDDVSIHDVNGVGFYSECAFTGGQHDYRDMPESAIGPLTIYSCASHNFQFRGPHDAYISELYSSSSSADGARFETDSSTYLGSCDIGLIHAYAANQYGIYSSTKIKADHLIGETCVREGVYLDTGAAQSQIGLLECFANDSGGAQTYYNALIAAAEVVIDNVMILDSDGSAGGLKISGANCRVSNGIIKSSSTTTNAVGADIDGASCAFKAEVKNWTGTDATGLRTANGAQRSNLNIDCYIENCYTGWNNVTAGNGGFYKVRMTTANKDHLLFTGAGPGTFSYANGNGVSAREIWDVIAVNTGTSHTASATSGTISTIGFAATASTRDDVYNGCIVTINSGTGSGGLAVVTDYVGSTQVASISAVGGTSATWTAPDTTSAYTVATLTLRTRTEGTATVANGNTSIRVAHGLLITSITPTVRNVKIWHTNNTGTGPEAWVSAVDKYTFTITVDADPGVTTATFGWEARLD
jgi:hypothetical protein